MLVAQFIGTELPINEQTLEKSNCLVETILFFLISAFGPAGRLFKFCLYHLAKFPEFQAKIQEEVKEIMAVC